MPRILATECVCAPAIASTLFIQVAKAAAFRFHFGAACFFAVTGFSFFALCKGLFAEDFEAPAALFIGAFAPAFTLAPACVFVLLFALFASTVFGITMRDTPPKMFRYGAYCFVLFVGSVIVFSWVMFFITR